MGAHSHFTNSHFSSVAIQEKSLSFGLMMNRRNENEDSLPLRIPKLSTAQILTRLKIRVLTFSSCFTISTIVLYFALILSQLILIIFWAKLHHELDVSMPRTFAWDVLIQFFGSTFDDCKDHSQPETILMTTKSNCGYYHSTPAVPIMAIILSSGFIVFALFYIVERFCFAFISNFALTGSLMMLLLQVLFTILEMILLCVHFGSKTKFLEDFVFAMKEEMKPSKEPPLIATKWQLIQRTFSCCGINNFTDWKFQVFQNTGNPRYPRSCCDIKRFLCRVYPSRLEVYSDGCLSPELDTVKSYAGLALGLTLIGLISSVLLVFVLYIMETIFRGHEQCTTKITFSRHPPSHKPSIMPLSPEINSPTTMTVEYDATAAGKEGGMIMIPNLGQGDGGLLNKRQQLTGVTHEKCNAFTLKRHTNLHVCVNSWGICCKSESLSVAGTHVLKKETLV